MDSPSLYDGDTDEDFIVDTPSPVFSLGKRKNINSDLSVLPKKYKTGAENLPPLVDNVDANTSRLSRTKKSTQSLKFDSALTKFKRQRLKRSNEEEIDRLSETKASFKLLSDTESDFDDSKEDSAETNKHSGLSSFSALNRSPPSDLPTIPSPSNNRTSKIAFACKRIAPESKTRVISESRDTENASLGNGSTNAKTFRRKRSIASSFVFSDSESSDSDFLCDKKALSKNKKGKALSGRSSQRKTNALSSSVFFSSPETSDAEISTNRSSTSGSSLSLRKSYQRNREPKPQYSKNNHDQFLPIASDVSSSDIDEADFSSFLNHLVGSDSDNRQPKRTKPTRTPVGPSSDSDDEIAILDFIVSGEKDQSVRKKAKDITFPKTSSNSRSKQGSLTGFVAGREASGKRYTTASSTTGLDTSTLLRANRVSSPSIQDSSVTDDLLLQALDNAEIKQTSSASPIVISSQIPRPLQNCRRPGLPRSAGKSSNPSVPHVLSTEASNAVTTEERLSQDEAFARQLQEEMDREVAASFRNTHGSSGFMPASSVLSQPLIAPPSTLPGRHTPPIRPDMIDTIGNMDEYVWQIHVAMYKGEDIPPAPPAYRNRDINELLNFGLLSYLDERRNIHPNYDTQKVRQKAITSKVTMPVQLPQMVPTAGSSRQPGTRGRAGIVSNAGTTRQNVGNPSIVARIGSMSEEEWDFHRAVFHGTPPRRSGRERNFYTLDTEVLQYLAEREAERLGRDAEIASQLYISDDSDKDIDDLLEQVRSTIYGGVGTRTRSSGRRGRGRGRGRGSGARGRRNMMYEEDDGGNDYENLLELAEQLGSVKATKGLSIGQIDMLPTKLFKSNSVKEGEAVPECHVCMCEYEENEKIRILTCFHSFHSECIDKWIKSNPSCPVCRIEIKLS